MKFFDQVGWWMPDQEQHLIEWMLTVNDRVEDRLTYQRRKYAAALPFTKQRRLAIDVGGHVGLWSWQMARDFASVIAFEPMLEHFQCWRSNMAGIGHAHIIKAALGETAEFVHLRTRTADSSGDTGVEPDGEGEVAIMLRLDDHLSGVDVDLIKMDCEGYEVFVCRGAEQLLLRCKPVVIVEQKPETGMEARYGIGTTDAVKFLEGLGAKRRRAIQGDYILSWD